MESHSSIVQLEKFDPKKYFDVGGDGATENYLTFTKLKPEGITLVSEYYADKYQINNLQILVNNEKASGIEQFITIFNSPECENLRNNTKEIRMPFILSTIVRVGHEQFESNHSIPLVYVKEDNQEAILILDSRKESKETNVLLDNIPMTIYTLNLGRQKDYYSCHSDALVFIRELTGKDELNNFLIPHILTRLKSEDRILNKDDEGNTAIFIRLFDRLLITAQNSLFIKQQKPGNEIIHYYKNTPETLNHFLARYPSDDAFSKEDELPHSYLRKKGLKYAEIIEMQFYLNQVKPLLGEHYATFRKEFIINAKKELLKQRSDDYFLFNSRSGIYSFTTDYVKKFMSEIVTHDLDRRQQNFR